MHHNSILTDEQVLEMRAKARAERRLNLRQHAAHYGVSHPTIFLAMTGLTFKHLEGPLVAGEYETSVGRARRMTDEQVAEMVALRESSPSIWTYAMLAKRCNRLYGLSYGPSNAQRMIERATGKRIERPAGAQSKSAKPRAIKPRPAPEGMKVIDTSSPEGRRALVARLAASRK